MATVTAKYALPRPSTGDPADGPGNFNSLTDVLDPLIATQASGTTAARPAAGKSGRLYWNTDAQALEYDTGSAWVQIRPTVPISATLPASGVDGQIANYQTSQMAGFGVVWQFRYRAAAPTYKWEFVGGPSMYGFSGAQGNTIGTTWQNFPDGSQNALPLAGDYEVGFGCVLGSLTGGASGQARAQAGGVGSAIVTARAWHQNGASLYGTVTGHGRLLNVPGGGQICYFAASSGSAGVTIVTFDRWTTVRPIRVAGG